MSENSFLREKATENIINNVASFCSECYSSLSKNQTIFYDTKECRYLCSFCQEQIQDKRKSYSALSNSTDEDSGFFI